MDKRVVFGNRWLPLWLILPQIVITLVFFYWPALQALVQSGRRVVSLDLRGHGGSEWPADGRYDFEAFVEDLRAVLAQLGGRPVVVAATLGGWVAAA